MHLKTIINSLNLHNWTPDLDQDISVTRGYISDMMSDVLANTHQGDLWITQQNHQGVVILASLKKIPVILLANSKQPLPEMIKAAKEEGIVILTSSLSAFEVAGRLYQLGLSGGRPVETVPLSSVK